MNVYFKGYSQRWHEIVLTIVLLFAASILSGILFAPKIMELSNQLANYSSTDYNYIYVLNYSAQLSNEFIFSDTDAQLYLDSGRQTRITASSIMKEKDACYELECLKVLNELSINEAIISKNVSDCYGLRSGDVVFVEYPFSDELRRTEIVGIIPTDYDYVKPYIDNGIGIVYLGYDEDYEKNVRCKYMEFSRESKSSILAEYPQIINTIINKSDNYNYVLKQGLYPLLFETFFSIVAIILGHMFFFLKSVPLLKRCFLKGMKRVMLIVIPLIERFLFGLIPSFTIMCINRIALPTQGSFMNIYSAIPFVLVGIYCLISFIDASRFYKRRI